MRRKYLYDSPSESSAEVEAYLSACWGPDPQSGAAFGGLAGGFEKLGPLPRTRGSTLARGYGRGGRVVLPLSRAAAVSTRLRLRITSLASIASKVWRRVWLTTREAWLGVGLGVGVRVRVRVRVRVGLGLGLGLG